MTPLLVVLAVSALVDPAHAQTVRGLLVEQGSGRPIQGAMVWLLADGGSRTGALSDSAGRFFIRAPAAGRYVARAERIGYEDAVSDTIRFSGAEYVDVRLESAPRAVTLAELVVRGEQRCEVRPRDGGESARLWEEARKALAAAAWTRDQGLYRYVILKWERILYPSTLRVYEEKRDSGSVFAREPIRSISAHVLDREGYIQPTPDGGWLYHAPDANVLLSDVFLDGHCFRARPGGREQPGLVGLAFEPVRGRDRSDVTGTLWLDRATGELRFIEYRYTRLPYDVPSHDIGGRIDLERLPAGAWIVRRWYIRMPQVAVTPRQRGGAPGTPSLIWIHEWGGEVTAMEAVGRPVR